jgi:riboflavin synthase
MFTGIVDDVGVIESVTQTPAGREFRIGSSYEDLVDGESIAVNGTCLTVRDRDASSFTVAAVVTTLGRTTIGDWSRGKRVNLERAMRADDRLGGHIVQGHVDGVGVVTTVERVADAVLVDVELPDSLGVMVVPHGSVAIDGVSLTVNAITGDRLQLSLIEYTLKHTAFGDLAAGSRVHVETDVIGKFVRRLVAPYINT